MAFGNPIDPIGGILLGPFFQSIPNKRKKFAQSDVQRWSIGS
jgi:hypothetical protein